MKHPTTIILDRMLSKFRIFRKHTEREEAIEKGEVKSDLTKEQRDDLYKLQLDVDKQFDDLDDLISKLK